MTRQNAAIEKRKLNQNDANAISAAQRVDQTTYYTPLVDIAENNDAFLFQADLPGVKSGDVDISYHNGTLTIEGKVHPRHPEGDAEADGEPQYIWREYGVGHFYRQFTIDAPIDVDGIRAELKNGELSLYVPKAESAKTRKIQIKAS